MNAGDSPEMVRTRRALLDALEGLGDHRNSVVVIGAQAVFIHTGSVGTAITVTTKDSDLAVNPELLDASPLLEDAMKAAGFARSLLEPQPGIWFDSDGVEVDLLVPDSLAGIGARGARIPPHDKHAARRAVGLEASLADNRPLVVESLEAGDARRIEVKVASPAALLVSKLHKIHERLEQPDRLNNKDAHDIYRLLLATPEAELAKSLARLAQDPIAGATTREALAWFKELFANGPRSPGCQMAGAAEEGVGDPAAVALSASVLAANVLQEFELRATTA